MGVVKVKITREEFETISPLFWIVYRLMVKFKRSPEALAKLILDCSEGVKLSVKTGKSEEEFVKYMRDVEPDGVEIIEPEVMGDAERGKAAREAAIRAFEAISPETRIADPQLVQDTISIMFASHCTLIFGEHETFEMWVSLLQDFWNMTHERKIDTIIAPLRPGYLNDPKAKA